MNSSSPANTQYAIGVNTDGAPKWLHENTSSGAQIYQPTGVSMPIGLCHFAATRTSQVIQFYLNGQPFGDPSSALIAPNGGSTSVFRIGNHTGLTAIAAIRSLKIVTSALSAAQIKNEYYLTLGNIYGRT